MAGWVNPKASWEVFVKQLKNASPVCDGPPTPSGPSKKRLRACDHQTRSNVTQTSLSNGSSHSEGLDQGVNKNTTKMELSEGSWCSVNHPVDGVETSLRSSPDFVLTGLHACGDLSATLLRHFVSCPHVRGITSVACCYMKITTKENPTPPGVVTPPSSLAPGSESFPSDFGYPMSSWVRALPGHQLSYKAREGACHAVEDYMQRLREGSDLLRTHCYRAILEAFIRETRPDLRRVGIQTIKKAHLLPFTE